MHLFANYTIEKSKYFLQVKKSPYQDPLWMIKVVLLIGVEEASRNNNIYWELKKLICQINLIILVINFMIKEGIKYLAKINHSWTFKATDDA